MRYQSLLAWTTLTGFLLGAAVTLTGAFGTHFGVWDYRTGMNILYPGITIGALALITGGVWLYRALSANNGMHAAAGLGGLLGALLLTGIPAHHLWLSFARPPIHDVSTDIGDAPAFHSLLTQRRGAPNPPDYDGPKIIRYNGDRLTVALAQKYAYQDIKPLERLAGTMPQQQFVAKYFWRSLNAVNALGWQVAGYDESAGRIEATSASFWFGTVSDIVIRVKPAGAIGVRVDIRAKSRIGRADQGLNAALVRAFLQKVKGS